MSSDSVLDLVSLLAFLFALATTGLTVLRVATAQVRRKQMLRQLEQQEFGALVETPDLQRFGEYLHGRIGSVAVEDYLEDETLRARVAVLLDKSRQFLDEGSLGWAQLGESLEGTLPGQDVATAGWPGLPDRQLWNTLAAMRREMELAFKRMAHDADLPPQLQRRGVGFLATELFRRRRLPQEVYGEARLAIGLANRAIHGEAVDAFEAERALNAGRFVLDFLSRHHPE